MRGSSFSSTSLAILALTSVGWSVSADAKKRQPEPEPCPLDVAVRVASSDTLKRFSSMESCVAQQQVIVAPDTDVEEVDDVRIRGRTADDEIIDPYAPAPNVRPAPAIQTSPNLANPDNAWPDVAPPAATQQQARQRAARIANADRVSPSSADPAPQNAVYLNGLALGESRTNSVRIAPIIPEGSPLIQRAVLPAPVRAAGGITAPTSSQGWDNFILGLRPNRQTPFDRLIAETAARHRLDPLMLHAVIHQESRYRANARSYVGARGLMQIMPATGASLGVANADYLNDPAINIDAGARYLKQLWTRFNGRFDLVLAGYNAGPGAVMKYGYRVPPYRETQEYVRLITAHYQQLAEEAGLLGALR